MRVAPKAIMVAVISSIYVFLGPANERLLKVSDGSVWAVGIWVKDGYDGEINVKILDESRGPNSGSKNQSLGADGPHSCGNMVNARCGGGFSPY